MQIVSNNGLIIIVDSDNNVLYVASDSDDASQFIDSYVNPEDWN